MKMKCKTCGLELSPKVWKIHTKRCKPVEQPNLPFDGSVTMDEPTRYSNNHDLESLRALGKEHGVKKYHVKGEKRLIEELVELGVLND